MSIGGFTQVDELFFRCETCGKEVERGIVNISGHWAECTGEGYMKLINKIKFKDVPIEDKMKEVRQIFNLPK